MSRKNFSIKWNMSVMAMAALVMALIIAAAPADANATEEVAVQAQPAAPEAKMPAQPASGDAAARETDDSDGENMKIPAKGTLQATVTVDSISAPVNPHETIMSISNANKKTLDVILSPATRYYPHDYYPCAGDKIKLSVAVVGAFNKKIFAYSVSLISEPKPDKEARTKSN